MQNNIGQDRASDNQISAIVTIDDLRQIAQVLAQGLLRLGEYKYPFAVRKGVSIMADKNDQSMIVKAGATTYFFDIKEAKTSKPYLLITESRFKGEGESRERRSLALFPDNAAEFSKTLSVMTAKLLEKE